ncbi:fibrous sheath CABYR-binding protein [Zeugodacus cucurbitae]|nr:fibrous sheath CABYR-binding protein [Zeugodacus cucurbitae]
MAKKGGVQQLQADIQTDEDFEKFLERPGLLVLDIYSEWCGPCLGMVGSLRKIKLEIGGDNLHLAICKSDTISYLKRFCKKSEPTWMFVTKGKATNLLFGSNTPKLMKLIAQELDMLNKPRTFYDITELQPEEERRRKVKLDAQTEAVNKEKVAKKKKRHDYLNMMTDIIIENIPDMGVTVFGPQVNRDMYKKLIEPAENMKLQCKDRRVINVNRADFDVVNYACPNPLSEDVLEQLDQKDLMMCFWKMPEDDRRPIPEVLNKYAHELTKERHEVDDLTEEEIVHPPIIVPMDLTIEIELQEGEEWEDEPEPEPEPPPMHKKTLHAKKEEPPSPAPAAAAPEPVEGEEDEGEEGSEGDEGGEGGEAGEGPEMPDLPMEPFDLDFDLDDGEEGEDEAEPEAEVEIIVQKRYRKKIIRIPPIWVAGNARTHAALIYVFFRQQTSGFLPPDPPPEPPHIIMAFDAYKKRDLISVMERLKDDVPRFGFFTSDEADEAKLIANSASKYSALPQNPSDKIVFKVNKQTSHTMLSLATYGPSYVSPDAVIGHEEALKFFPESYKTAEQEAVEIAERESMKPKKKKQKRSVKGEADQAPATSAEESGESRPTTAPDGDETLGTDAQLGDSAADGEQASAAVEGSEALPEGSIAAQADAEAPPAAATGEEAAPAPPAEHAEAEGGEVATAEAPTEPEVHAEAPAEAATEEAPPAE